jgi:hypothetical protein
MRPDGKAILRALVFDRDTAAVDPIFTVIERRRAAYAAIWAAIDATDAAVERCGE